MTAPRIMVVDDDVDLRELICDYLSSNGYDVRGAAIPIEGRSSH